MLYVYTLNLLFFFSLVGCCFPCYTRTHSLVDVPLFKKRITRRDPTREALKLKAIRPFCDLVPLFYMHTHAPGSGPRVPLEVVSTVK
jgi:hypothetical protein